MHEHGWNGWKRPVVHILRFSMPCPYYHYDEVSGVETECENTLDITYVDRDEWYVEGCPHAEDPVIFGSMQNAIEDAINEEAITQAGERAAAREYERSEGY